MAKKKATFGSMVTGKVRFVIAIIHTDNTLTYVTDVQFSPHKYCLWEKGKNAHFFTERIVAEDTCFGLNANGTGAFVIEVPDYYCESSFKNND